MAAINHLEFSFPNYRFHINTGGSIFTGFARSEVMRGRVEVLVRLAGHEPHGRVVLIHDLKGQPGTQPIEREAIQYLGSACEVTAKQLLEREGYKQKCPGVYCYNPGRFLQRVPHINQRID